MIKRQLKPTPMDKVVIEAFKAPAEAATPEGRKLMADDVKRLRDFLMSSKAPETLDRHKFNEMMEELGIQPEEEYRKDIGSIITPSKAS